VQPLEVVEGPGGVNNLFLLLHSKEEHLTPVKTLRIATQVGCQIGYMHHTGCHQMESLTIRPTRVAATPGCQIGHMDHTGCHQSVLLSIRPSRVVTPRGCQIGHMDHTGCHQLLF
jgi:hypothetical protein